MIRRAIAADYNFGALGLRALLDRVRVVDTSTVNQGQLKGRAQKTEIIHRQIFTSLGKLPTARDPQSQLPGWRAALANSGAFTHR